MTGWRIGFAVGRPELIAALTRVKSYMDTGPFLAVQKAGAATLDQAEAIVEPIRAELEAPARRGRGGAAGGGIRAGGAEGGDVSLGRAAGRHCRRPRSPSRALEETGTVVLPGQRLRSGGRRLLPHRAHGRRGPAARWPRPGWAGRSGAASRRACPGYLKSGCRPRGAGRGSRIAASIGVHSLLLFGWIEGRQPILPRRPSQLIVLAPPAEGPAAVADALSGCRARRGAPAPGIAGDRAHRGRRSARVRNRWPSCREPVITPPKPDTGSTPPPAPGPRPADRPDRRRPGRRAALGAAAAAPAQGAGAAAHARATWSWWTARSRRSSRPISTRSPAIPRRAGQALPSWTQGDRRQEVRDRLEEHLHRGPQDSGGGAGAAADSRPATSIRTARTTI